MRDAFRGYYPIGEGEDRMWSDGLIVLDTNVLLSMYEQSAVTRGTLVDALTLRKAQLWMPHQVGVEFHRNKTNARAKAAQRHNTLSSTLKSGVASVQKQLENLAKYDPLLETDDLFENLVTAADAIVARVGESKKRIDNDRKLAEDPVFAAVSSLYPAEKIGRPFSPKQLSRHRRLGQERIIAEQPPGYLDARDKSGDGPLGDYFLWAQTIKHARSADRDVILVTDDAKRDWMESAGSPRPELLSEFHAETGRLVLIMSAEDFVIQESKRTSKRKTATARAAKAAAELNTLKSLYSPGDVLNAMTLARASASADRADTVAEITELLGTNQAQYLLGLAGRVNDVRHGLNDSLSPVIELLARINESREFQEYLNARSQNANPSPSEKRDEGETAGDEAST